MIAFAKALQRSYGYAAAALVLKVPRALLPLRIRWKPKPCWHLASSGGRSALKYTARVGLTESAPCWH
eukprot:10153409-Alexandrium_andersonii.AAC.1